MKHADTNTTAMRTQTATHRSSLRAPSRPPAVVSSIAVEEAVDYRRSRPVALDGDNPRDSVAFNQLRGPLLEAQKPTQNPEIPTKNTAFTRTF